MTDCVGVQSAKSQPGGKRREFFVLRPGRTERLAEIGDKFREDCRSAAEGGGSTVEEFAFFDGSDGEFRARTAVE